MAASGQAPMNTAPTIAINIKLLIFIALVRSANHPFLKVGGPLNAMASKAGIIAQLERSESK